MKIGKASALGLAIILSGLTACSPPMPPEVRAALSEAASPCVADGTLTVSTPSQYLDLVQTFANDYTSQCPSSTVNIVAENSPADIAISDVANPTGCQIVAGGPIGYDAAAIVFNQSSLSAFNLAPKNLSTLLNGKISDWADKSLIGDNPDAGLTSAPLVLSPQAYGPALAAVNSWGHSLDSANWTDSTALKTFDKWDTATSLDQSAVENSVTVVPLSQALNSGLTTVGVTLPHESYPVASDLSGTFAAAGQLAITNDSANVIRTTIDPKLAPQKANGADTATLPWQAVYAVSAFVCKGSNELPSRAFARFMLRLDEQTQNQGYSIVEVPEAIRLVTAGVIEQGLPTPSASPGQ